MLSQNERIRDCLTCMGCRGERLRVLELDEICCVCEREKGKGRREGSRRDGGRDGGFGQSSVSRMKPIWRSTGSRKHQTSGRWAGLGWGGGPWGGRSPTGGRPLGGTSTRWGEGAHPPRTPTSTGGTAAWCTRQPPAASRCAALVCGQARRRGEARQGKARAGRQACAHPHPGPGAGQGRMAG